MVASPVHHQLEARQGPCDYWGEDSDQCKGFKAYTSSTGNAVQQSNTATAATTTSTTASDDDTGDDNNAATSFTTSLALGGTTATLSSGTEGNNAKATATNTIVSSDDSSNTIATTSPSTLETSITSFSDVTSTGPQTIVGGGLGSDLASSTTTSSPTASGLSLQQKQPDDDMTSGAVAAAIVVPVLFALLALTLTILCLRRRRRRRNHLTPTTASHTHFLTPMREKFSRSSPRNSLPPPTASLATGPPILTSPHNNTYNTGLDTPSGTSHRGQSSDEYYAVLPPRRSEGGTFLDPPPPYKPSSLASASSAHSAEAGGDAPAQRGRTAYHDQSILAPPLPTATLAAAAASRGGSYRDSSHRRSNRWSLGPFTDLAATSSHPNDDEEGGEEDSRPSTAATASTFRAHPLSSSGGTSGRSGSGRSGSGRSWTSSNNCPGMRDGTDGGGLSPYDIPSRNGQGMIPGGIVVGGGGGAAGGGINDTRSPTPRSFSSEMYSDTASVHSARAGLVRDVGPRVLGSSARSGHESRVGMREGDPFGDPRRSQMFGDDETEGEEWHSLTGSGGGRSEGGSGSGGGLGSFEWEERGSR